MVLDSKTGAVWCWMRQVQCGAGSDRCSVVLDDETAAVWCWMRRVQCGAGIADKCNVVLD